MLFTGSVLRELVHEPLARWGELAQLQPHHVVCDFKLDVLLAVVDLELEADELGEDVTQPRVRPHGGAVLDRLRKRERHHVGPFPRQPLEHRQTRSHVIDGESVWVYSILVLSEKTKMVVYDFALYCT